MPNALSKTPRLDKKTFCYETCGSNLFMRINRAAGEPIFIHSSFARAIRLLDKFLWKPQTSFFSNSALIIYIREFEIQIKSRAKPRARFREVQECLVGLFRTRKLFNFSFLKFPSPWLSAEAISARFISLGAQLEAISTQVARANEWMKSAWDEARKGKQRARQ